jgi:hypothetical protein
VVLGVAAGKEYLHAESIVRHDLNGEILCWAASALCSSGRSICSAWHARSSKDSRVGGMMGRRHFRVPHPLLPADSLRPVLPAREQSQSHPPSIV